MIDPNKCVGCGECIIVCPQSAVQVQWSKSVPIFMKKMVEYSSAVLRGKAGKAFFINFITSVSPACDCAPYADTPLIRDVGILASTDPVAIDQASVDLLNREAALPGCCLETNTGPGEDKVRGVFPEIDWSLQLAYAQEIGLGSRDYELLWLPEKLKKETDD